MQELTSHTTAGLDEFPAVLFVAVAPPLANIWIQAALLRDQFQAFEPRMKVVYFPKTTCLLPYIPLGENF